MPNVRFEDIRPGDVVHRRERPMQPASYGLVIETRVDESPAGLGGGAAAGELWRYENVVIQLEDGERFTVTIQSFDWSPAGAPPSFRLVDDDEQERVADSLDWAMEEPVPVAG